MRNGIEFDFSDTSVLITGGTSGIGLAVASAFAQAGASVTITGTKPSADDYEVDLTRFIYRNLQVRDPKSVDELSEQIDHLDVLVNNAGANFPDGKDEWGPDAFSAALELNVEGAMRLTMRLFDVLAKSAMGGGASVVNMVSMTAFRSTRIVPGYSAAKAALLSLTRNMAVHWAGEGIRVNAVAPGIIETPMTAPMKSFPELLNAELERCAIRRMGTPKEVASVVLFLSSEASSFTTGAVFAVDGGYLAM